MNHFNFNIGDTNFICLVDPHTYMSYVDEDWDLIKDLIPHVLDQQQKGNILMYQMTAEGIEEDWKIAVSHELLIAHNYLKKSINYISVTHEELYLIDYTNLTMAAQFTDELIPDKDCESFKVALKNGNYTVTTYLFKDVDKELSTNKEIDMLLIFQPYDDSFVYSNNRISWGSF